MYLLTRADLSPGQQATQGSHAAFRFAYEHPLLLKTWYEESTYLVLLSVPTEAELGVLAGRLIAADLVVSLWREPDMGNELTSVAVAPSLAAQRLLSSLPLTLREEPAMSG